VSFLHVLRSRRLKLGLLAGVAVLTTGAVPSALAQPADPVGTTAQPSQPSRQDVRIHKSDQRVLAPTAETRGRVFQDLRSPDARDSGRPIAHSDPVFVPVARRPVDSVTVTADDFNWGSAGIGAGAISAFLLLVAGAGWAVLRHRHRILPGPGIPAHLA
jgi:hypothetical protein